MARPRVLFVTPFLPWPLMKGGGAQRTELIHRALSRFADVDLGDISDWDVSQEPKARRFNLITTLRISEDAPQAAFSPDERLSILRYGREFLKRHQAYQPPPERAKILQGYDLDAVYDLIVFRHTKTAAVTGAKLLVRTPFIVDVDDVDWHIIKNQRPVRSAIDWLAVNVAVTQRKLIVMRLLRSAAAYWVSSKADREEIGGTVLGNVPFHEADEPAPSPLPPARNSLNILLVGMLTYPPNLNGLKQFLTHSWPLILAREPKATLTVVGQILDTSRREVESAPSVRIAGFVPDLEEEYRNCAFTIAPVREGGGTKIKVVESLAYGRTCVVTPNALHGYEDDFRPVESLLLANNSEEMADCCVRLLRDADLRDRLADHGARVAGARYSVASFMKTVEDTCQSVIQARDAKLAKQR